MTIIALDDEPLALLMIEKLASTIPALQLLGSFTDATAAADFLHNNTVDLLISDINMPDVDGLQFVRQLPGKRPMVIFLTAYKEHALDSYDLDVVDYLIKPVIAERFQRAIAKAADLMALRAKAAQADAPLSAPETHFFVFSEYQQVKITIAEILYIESMADYVKIYLSVQKSPVLTLERLKNLAERLAPHGFRRIHRSYVVNVEKITVRQKSRVQVRGVWLPVGEAYKL